jgi:hypothetical protein
VITAASLAVLLRSADAEHVVPDDEPSAVYGGEPSPSCAWPSSVWLGGCSGTLVHPEIVMYAGHCGDVIPTVYFGEDYADPQSPGDGFSVATEYCMTNPAADEAQTLEEFRATDFAFCKLAEPVLDVPIVPPLVGCETTILLPGVDVTLVGFGRDEEDDVGVKRQVTTVLHYIDDQGVAVIGGDGESSCNGDSGGPAYVQLPDGTWRAFGIVSGPNVGSCGDPGWYATSFLAVPFIEQHSGIDVTPCHYGSGEWNPSPACREFPLAPEDGEGLAWADGCAGGPESEWGSACGPAFDASRDLLAPVATIDEPEDRARFDTDDDATQYVLTVGATASDDTSGVQHVALAIDGAVIEGGQRLSPPWEWTITLPPGVWALHVVATDWAGNASESPLTVIGIDEDPPPAPEPETSSGAPADTSSSDGGEASTTSTTGTTTETSGTSNETSGGATQAAGDGGCGCGSTNGRAPWGLLVLAFARRRR